MAPESGENGTAGPGGEDLARSVRAWFENAVARHRAGDLVGAERAYRRLLEVDPDNAGVLGLLGALLGEAGRTDEGLALLDRALDRHPGNVDALVNRATVLMRAGRTEAALASLDRAVALRPDHVDAQANRGRALRDLDRPAEAIAAFDAALALRPDLPGVMRDRGEAFLRLDRPAEALAAFAEALVRDPGDVDAAIGRGRAALELERFDGAIEAFRDALTLRPGHAGAELDAGLVLLALGHLPDGLRLYERRRDAPALAAHFAARTGGVPAWSGREPIAGRRLFVHWEQGLGDTLQFCRFLPMLERAGADIVFSAQNRLHALLSTLSPTIRLVDEAAGPEDCDFRIALASLPLACGVTPATIPAAVPYLAADPARIARFAERIGPQGFRIGIAWQGRPGRAIDFGRSIPLAAFAGLARLPGVRLIALQKNEGLEQLADLPPDVRIETLGEDFDAGPDAFLDTAAAMSVVDLVVTSDTSIAHLAGALGRPTRVMLKRVPDWRWLLGRPDSPWYPTLRLHRQPVRGDWAGAFGELEAELRAGLAARAGVATPRVPISWGELLDKITILELKSAALTAPAALANVRHELALLEAIAAPLADRPGLAALRAELAAVNADLWAIEDAIREKERAKSFDDGFVALARSVYRRNDARAALKRQINALLGSELVEEKHYADYDAP